jgi:hypothetical protein
MDNDIIKNATQYSWNYDIIKRIINIIKTIKDKIINIFKIGHNIYCGILCSCFFSNE